MSISIGKTVRRSVATAAGAALMLGAVAAPAQASSRGEADHPVAVVAQDEHYFDGPRLLVDTLFAIIGLPILISSALSSQIETA